MGAVTSPARERERALLWKATAEAFEAMEAERPVGVFETFVQREERAMRLGLEVVRKLLQGDLDHGEESSGTCAKAACPDCHEMCEVVGVQNEASSKRRIVTRAGNVLVGGAMYRCSRCRRSFFPSAQSSGAGH